MKEKHKDILNDAKDYFFKEIVISGIGWVAGLISVSFMSNYFTQKSWSNIWGLWTDKIIVEKSTYEISEKIITVVLGFIVMKLINSILIPIFIRKKEKN